MHEVRADYDPAIGSRLQTRPHARRARRSALLLPAFATLVVALPASLAGARASNRRARVVESEARLAGARVAVAPSAWITIPPEGGEQVRVQFLAAYRTPRLCVRYGNCTHGPKGDYIVFTLRLQSVSLRRECVPVHGFMCAGEFTGVFNFGPGIKPCPSAGPALEETGATPGACGPGRVSWSNAAGEVPGGFAGGDLSSPSKVVGNLVPGKTITYRYALTLADSPGHDRHVHSLADIWMSLDGGSFGTASNFARVSELWPAGRLVGRARIR